MLVALFARAWIEIQWVYGKRAEKETSPSLRGRGLKYLLPNFYLLKVQVALFARAWIEISESIGNAQRPEVALFARAWIEIKNRLKSSQRIRCRPLCEGVD